MMTNTTDSESVIWCLMDGRAGHQNQVLGLAEALCRQTSAKIYSFELPALRRLLTADAFSLAGNVQSPDLIIGAGHKSHFALCILKRRFRARSVVLMKPSMPLGWFDLCLVPTVHNLKNPPANVIQTTGVLNRIQRSEEKQTGKGLCLIGGPSNHYLWDDHNVSRQLSKVLADSDGSSWTIVTSRRTPESFIKHWTSSRDSASVVTADEVSSDWLPAQLAAAETTWVTEDSVSMMYESLTSGATVGVLELPRRKDNRVTECTDSLVRSGDVTRWHIWRQTGRLPQPEQQLCESDRCANLILQRGLLPRHSESDEPEQRAAA